MRFPQPRSAYVHVPFCRRRCGYCNFTVVAGRDDLFAPLIKALDLEFRRGETSHAVDTLYLGGGTPTHLGVCALAQLLEIVRRWRPLADGGEWTIEANPEDVTEELVALLLKSGVTRVSLGVQSFQNDKLRRLEREHSGEDAVQAIHCVQQAGLEAAVDLMFAAPDEGLDAWRRDLSTVAACSPGHVSAYGMTFERGASFWSRRAQGRLVEVDEDLQRAMYLEGIDRLQQAGFEHYEVSNFAMPGRRSRHNEVYWSGRQYYAEGPGAARYVGGIRETNHRSTTTYLKRLFAGRSPVADRERLDNRRRAGETLVLGLRTMAGVDRDRFLRETGFTLDEVAGTAVARFVQMGLLADDQFGVRLTRDGLLVSDSLWPDLL